MATEKLIFPSSRISPNAPRFSSVTISNLPGERITENLNGTKSATSSLSTEAKVVSTE